MAQKACGGEFRYKVILLGNHGVGKTSIFRRIKDDTFFDQKTETTLGGIDIHQMTRKVGNDTIVVSVCVCVCVCVLACMYLSHLIT